MIIITTVDHHVKQRAGEESVNETQFNYAQQISRANDSLHLQAMKATYCPAADACSQPVRLIQEG
jgi:hypothetical protein